MSRSSFWIIDYGASDHVASNSYLFSSLYCKGIGHVSPTPSVPLKSVLFIPGCPFNLIFLSQLTQTLNYSITFNANSFVIQDHGLDQTIEVGHKLHGLYYLQPSSVV